jgi:hypothetical protein
VFKEYCRLGIDEVAGDASFETDVPATKVARPPRLVGVPIYRAIRICNRQRWQMN